MRVTRVALGSIAALSLLAVLLIAVLTFLDLSFLSGRLESAAAGAFGRRVSIDGLIRLKPSLWPVFVAEEVRIGNPDWASRPDLARVGRLEVQVALLPLFSGELELLAVTLKRADVLLEVKSDDTNNYTFGSREGPPGLPDIDTFSIQDSEVGYKTAEGKLHSCTIGKTKAQNVPEQPVTLEGQVDCNGIPLKFSLLGGTPEQFASPTAPWPMALTVSIGASDVAGELQWYQTGARPVLKGKITSQTLNIQELFAYSRESLAKEAKPDVLDRPIAMDWISAIDAELKIDIQSLLGSTLPIGDIAGTFKLDNGRLTVSPLRATLADTAVTGNLSIVSKKNLPTIRLTADSKRIDLGKILKELKASDRIQGSAESLTLALASRGHNLRGLIRRADLSLKLEGGHVHIGADKAEGIKIAAAEIEASEAQPLRIKVNGEYRAMPLTVEVDSITVEKLVSGPKAWPFQVKARAVDALFAADGTMTWNAGAPAFELKATLEGDRAASLNGLFGTSLPDTGPYRFSAGLRKSKETLVVSDLKGRIGASDVEGELQWKQAGARPVLKGKITSQSLHVQELFATSKRNSGNDSKRDVLDRSIQLDWLTAMDAELEIDIGRVLGSAMSIGNTVATVKLDNGRLTVSPLQATFAGSAITGDLSVVLGNDVPAIKLNANSTGLDLGKVLGELEVSKKIRGNLGNLSFAVASRGNTIRSLLRSADLSLKTGEGTILYGEDKVEEVKIAAAEIEVKEAMPVRLSVEGKFRAMPVALDVNTVTLEALASETGPWSLGISLNVPQASLKANGSVTHPFEGRGFNLGYEISGKNLKEVGPLVDLLLPLSGPFEITGRFTDEPDRYLLSDIEIKVGQSDLGGSMVIVTGEPHPKISVKMSSRTVRYEDLEFVTGVAEDKKEEGRVIPEYVIPVDALLAVDVDFHLEIERIRLRRADLAGLLITATLENGRLVKSTRYSSNVTGTRISFKHEGDFTTDPPVHSIHLTARELDYGLMLTEAEATDFAEGLVDIDIELAGPGATKRSFLSQANGHITVTGGLGRIGSLALRLWSAGITDLTTKMLSAGWRREAVTELNCIAGRIEVENGVARTDKLLLDTRRLTVAGSGTLALDTEELDFLLSPNPKEQRFLSFANPVRVTGTLSSPTVDITRLPRVRAFAPIGRLYSLVNPVYLLSAFSEVDSGDENACVVAIEKRDKEPDDERQRRNILRRFRRLF